MKKILIYDRVANDHIPRWLSGLVKYLHNHEYAVDTMSGICCKSIADYDFIFIWNGELSIHRSIKAQAQKYGIPIIIVEVGFFPQSRYYILDPEGINATSSIMDDDLTWVTDQHIKRLIIFAKQYLAGRSWLGDGGYILCPLQLESDTNIIKNSPHKTMQSFIQHVEQKFPDEEIWFKSHPLCSKRYKTKHLLISSGNFLDMAVHAKMVYGINSTCLLEATMLGVPVQAIGDGFVKQHGHQPERLLAVLVDRQISVGEVDLDYWVQPFLKS